MIFLWRYGYKKGMDTYTLVPISIRLSGEYTGRATQLFSFRKKRKSRMNSNKTSQFCLAIKANR